VTYKSIALFLGLTPPLKAKKAMITYHLQSDEDFK